MRVYLAGPVSDGENPYEWHERIQQTETNIDWVNPFTLHDFPTETPYDNAPEIIERDLEAVRSSDAILLRRISGYNLSGASIEAREAWVNDIPVIVWNDAESQVPLFLSGHSTAICESADEAIEKVKILSDGAR